MKLGLSLPKNIVHLWIISSFWVYNKGQTIENGILFSG